MSIIQFKEANCKNCYKCIRNCPIKVIAFRNDQAEIVEEECILCGRCLTVCPQNAKTVKSDIDRVKGFLSKNEKVYVSLAPSYVAAFDTDEPERVVAALFKLGVTHVEETAIGATQVSKEYGKLMNDKKMSSIITTCCPSIVSLVERYYPTLIDQMAPVVSPMVAHARMMRSMYGPRIKIVFIGPCIAKKRECTEIANEGSVDAVLTFEELEKWMDMEGIDIKSIDAGELKGLSNPAARLYPSPGGIIKTLHADDRKKYKCISVDGIDRCIEILDWMKEGKVKSYFIEMNSCTGGCLGGPCIGKVEGGFLGARDKLLNYARKKLKDPTHALVEDAKAPLERNFIDRSKPMDIPDEDTIRSILSMIGKVNKDKELNCGACGYSTCRDKAIAVYNKKADLKMCLPYMREKAESISNIIMHNSPNALIALDKNLIIQEYNLSACKLFKMEDTDMSGKHIYEILNCPDFEAALQNGENILDKKYYYDAYGITVMQSIIYVREYDMIIAIIKDITENEEQRKKIYSMRSETIDIAQKVIEKQMRVAQEIASLLGETTAETKVALTGLKKSILADMGEEK